MGNNIKMDIQEDRGSWIALIGHKKRDRWQAFVKAVMNFQVP